MSYTPPKNLKLSGDTTGVTPSPGDNDTSFVTSAFVTAAVAPYLLLAGGTMAGNLALAANVLTSISGTNVANFYSLGPYVAEGVAGVFSQLRYNGLFSGPSGTGISDVQLTRTAADTLTVGTGDVIKMDTAAENSNNTTLATTAYVERATGNASSNRPACRINGASVPGGIVATTTDTLVSFASETYDTDSMHDTSTNTSRITVQTAGNYIITSNCGFTATATTGFAYATLFKNGSAVAAGPVETWVNSAVYGTNVSVTHEDQAVAGDYYEVKLHQTTGANRTVSNCNLQVMWVGGTGAAWGNAGVKVYKTSAQTMTLASTFYNVTWDSEVFDTGAMHDVASNTDRLTITTPGMYDVKSNLLIAPTTGAFYWTCHMYHYNSAGTLIRRSVLAEGYSDAKAIGSYTQVPLNCHEQCDVGDYFVVACQTNVAGLVVYGDNTGFGIAGSNFSAVRVGYQTNPAKDGQRVTGGVQKTTTNPFSAAVLAAARTTSLAALTLPGDGANKMLLKLDFARVDSSAASDLTIELWDGAVGSGTLIASRYHRVGASSVWGNLGIQAEVAAYTGSKTFNVSILTSSASTISVYAGATNPQWFLATWCGP